MLCGLCAGVLDRNEAMSAADLAVVAGGLLLLWGAGLCAGLAVQFIRRFFEQL